MLLPSEIKPFQRLLTGQERETPTSQLRIKRKGNEGALSHHPLPPMNGEQKGRMTGECEFFLFGQMQRFASQVTKADMKMEGWRTGEMAQ